jgi:hypothetical protein
MNIVARNMKKNEIPWNTPITIVFEIVPRRDPSNILLNARYRYTGQTTTGTIKINELSTIKSTNSVSESRRKTKL